MWLCLCEFWIGGWGVGRGWMRMGRGVVGGQVGV